VNILCNPEIKDELIKLLHSDIKTFYKGCYEGTEYRNSNLLFSILMNIVLEEEKYYEDVNVSVFYEAINNYCTNNLEMPLAKKQEIITLLKDINDITDDICLYNGITFSFEDFFGDKVGIKELKKELVISDNIIETLESLDKVEKKLLENLKAINSPLAKLVFSGARGNQKQLGQSFIALGYKVDNDSNILPRFIETSFLEGFKSKKDFFTASIAARNAIIQSTSSIASSGYLNRKLCFLCTDIELSRDTEDCMADKEINTANLLKINLNKDNKKLYLNRWILDEEKNEFVLINKKNIEKYFGVRYLRSPITCSCKTGICKKCYGELWRINKDYNIGILSATAFTEITSQKLLSTKHLLIAYIEKFNSELLKLIKYDFDSNTIISITEDEISVCREKDDIYINGIKFIHPFKHIEIKDIFSFEIGTVLFETGREFINQDMNKALNEMNSIFNKTGRMNEINTFQEYYEELISFMRTIKVHLESIHMELILSQMIRTADNFNIEWRLFQDKDYVILGVTEANLNQGNIFSNILFERVKQSLTNLGSFTDYYKPSKYEQFFLKK